MTTPPVERSDVPCTWCPGCGNFGILQALQTAFSNLDLPRSRLLMVSGIGQATKTPHYLTVNTFNGLHGRALPVAQAARLAARDLTVVVNAGDGDAYGEGGNHLLHAIRRNVDLTLLVHDNRVYGLTKGQASPTTPQGQRAAGEPRGVGSAALDPLSLAVSQNCSFVAQGWSGRVETLANLILAAVQHRGFSLVNVLQPCVSFNKIHSGSWFRDHADEVPVDHDAADRLSALTLLAEFERRGRLPLGVVYRHERPVFEDGLPPATARPLRERLPEPSTVLPLLDRFR